VRRLTVKELEKKRRERNISVAHRTKLSEAWIRRVLAERVTAKQETLEIIKDALEHCPHCGKPFDDKPKK
jgi:predicted transcriptional regulator